MLTVEDLRAEIRRLEGMQQAVGHLEALIGILEGQTRGEVPNRPKALPGKGKRASKGVPSLTGRTFHARRPLQAKGRQVFGKESASGYAREILRKHGNRYMHFAEIAKEARDMGYRSLRHGDDLESIQTNFYATLRTSRVFERRPDSDKPEYRVKEEYLEVPEPEEASSRSSS